MKFCGFEVGLDHPLFLMAGPCVIESEQMALDVAAELRDICTDLAIPFIYKSSFDKANRSSTASFRGLGIEKGLAILEKVRSQIKVPVVTDVHEDTPLEEVASVVDVLQTPAFLCRQTNFIQNVARQQKPVNIKKGSFCHRGTCNRQSTRHVKLEISKSWSANAEPASAITTWYPTCAPWQ